MADTKLSRAEQLFLNNGARVIFGGHGSDEAMCFNFSHMSVVRGEADPPLEEPKPSNVGKSRLK